MLSVDQKENVCPPSLRGSFANKNDSNKIVGKKGEEAKPKSKGTFGSLLTDATNQIRDDGDSALAFEAQTDEACEVVMKWIREENDAKVASELAKSLDEEDEKEKSIAIASGESAAIKIAVEERKRQKMEAQSKQEQEKLDAEFAKRCVIDEENDLLEKRKVLESDEKYVQELVRSKSVDCDEKPVADAKTSSRPRKTLSDHKLDGGSSLRAESKDSGIETAAPASRDFKESKESKESKPSSKDSYDEDFEFACRSQKQLRAEEIREKARQEHYDEAYSRKVAAKIARDEHERVKRLNVLSSIVSFPTHKRIAKQWLEATAEVENVLGGICITLLLPSLIKLKVRSDGQRKVTIDAHRMRQDDDKEFNRDNSQYLAEFNIRGKDVRVQDKDMYYNYFSETGLLFIYIDRVSLDSNAPGPSCNSSSSSTDSQDSSASSGSSKIGSSKGSSMMGNLKNGFKRIFNMEKREEFP